MSLFEAFYEQILNSSERISPLESFYSSLLTSTATSTLLNRSDLRGYQHVTINLIKNIWSPDGPPGVIVALEPGAGKTVSTLTALDDGLKAGFFKKPLITAPLLVASTVWHVEALEWEHLKHLSFSLVIGNEKQRIAALNTEADIYITNKESLVWLWNYMEANGGFDFDCLVIDEASMLKNGKKRTPNKNLTRFGALAQARKRFSGVIELTGTPAPNGVVNLWGLAYMIDLGQRLGRTKNAFNERWMIINPRTYEVKPRVGAAEDIMSRMKDIMFSLDPKDYVELPPLVENIIKVKLPPKVMVEYKKFKESLVYEPEMIEALNAAVLTNKLLQAANGSLIDQDGNIHWLHDAKLDALENLINEIGESPTLVAYSYRFDKDRIKKRFPRAVILNEQPDVMKTVRDWNAGKIDMLLAHPASAAHGLNLQKGSNISIWYGLTSDLELYQQFNKRLWRSGQKAERVWSHTIIAEGTHDEKILPILRRKDAVQSMVLKATQITLDVQKTLD